MSVRAPNKLSRVLLSKQNQARSHTPHCVGPSCSKRTLFSSSDYVMILSSQHSLSPQQRQVTKPSRSPVPSDVILSKTSTSDWKALGLGARLPKDEDTRITNLLFVQMGFGVDQHGNDASNASGSGGGATKAALRAVRNAIEFNSIPGVIEAVPGGRAEMLISVKLGVPTQRGSTDPMEINLNEVAQVFPYGRLLPMEVVVGGLSFNTGRVVRELGDDDDVAVCVAACVSIGYDNGKREDNEKSHKLHDTKDGV